MRIGVVIQARMGSTRLKGKVLLELKGETVLQHIVERVRQSKKVDEIIVATTSNENDDIIEKEALKYGVKVFRGSEEDVLARYYLAAQKYKLDIITRITADCPLVDPNIIDDMLEKFESRNIDLLSNGGANLSDRTFPRGLDVSIFSYKALCDAFNNATKSYQREHVTPYIYENYKVMYYKNDKDFSNHRWTLDTKEDFILISKIYDILYKGKHDFYFRDILNIFEVNPHLILINQNIEQKTY